MLDFQSYTELEAEFHNSWARTGRKVHLIDKAFGVYSGSYDVFSNDRTGRADEDVKIWFIIPQTKMLTPDELAATLGHSRTYVYAMRKAGFPMVGRLASPLEAWQWLEANPHFLTTGGAK